MIVYLDWNCITHLKDNKNKEILDFIISHNKELYFPYSEEHFFDLMRSYPTNDNPNDDFNKDINILSSISNNILISYDNISDSIVLMRYSPKDFLTNNLLLLKFMSTDFNFDMFKELVSNEIGDEQSNMYFDNLRSCKFEKIMIPILNVEFDNFYDYLKSAFDSAYRYMFDVKFFQDLILRLQKSVSSDITKMIGNANSNDLESSINNLIVKKDPQLSLQKILSSTLDKISLKNKQSDFITRYHSYNLMNFHTDRKSSGINITSDAKHAFLGGYCNYLVTSDKKMKLKTEAIYNYYNITTKVISLSQLISTLSDL